MENSIKKNTSTGNNKIIHVTGIFKNIMMKINAIHENPKLTSAVYTRDKTNVLRGNFDLSIRFLLSFNAVIAVVVAVEKKEMII